MWKRDSPPSFRRRNKSDRLPLHPDHTLREIEQEKNQQQRFAVSYKERRHASRTRENSFFTSAAIPIPAATSAFHIHLNAPVFTSAAVVPPTIKPVSP